MTKDLGKLWAERMTKSERDMSFPDSEPRDAATLMLIDRSGAKPKVLLGRRHANHKFMPGKFVFPGGRIEALDRKSTRLNSSHLGISYAVFCLKKKSHRRRTDSGDQRRALRIRPVADWIDRVRTCVNRNGTDVRVGRSHRQHRAARQARDAIRP